MQFDDLLGNPTPTRILEVIEENENDRTLLFEFKKQPTAGQFCMVWIPSIDEIPMSFSFITATTSGITVRPIGAATNVLASKKPGDWIGIRGPFGTGFNLAARRPLIVGGGIGMAPLRPLVYELLARKAEITLVIAARTSSELLYVDELRNLSKNIQIKITTDDGTAGAKGLATDIIAPILIEKFPDMIYTCGPEKMMLAILKIAKENGIPFQASLERYMKCGCGICGTCALDYTGQLVCVDGPVFDDEQLSTIVEFGKYYRDAIGIKHLFK